MLNIENKIYYYPYYCYRHFPCLQDGVIEFFNKIIRGKKVGIYQNRENAVKAGEEMLSGDDAFGIFVIDWRDGFPKIKENINQIQYKVIANDLKKFVEIKD